MPVIPEKQDDFSKPDDLEGLHIILDANALMAPFQQRFNLDLELQRVAPGFMPVVPSSVMRELEFLKNKGDWRAKASLDLAGNYTIVDVKGKGDAPIFNLAVKMKWMVMTMDRKLRLNLLRRGIPVIILKGKGHLEVMEP